MTEPGRYADALRQAAPMPVELLSELRALADAIRRTPGLQVVLVDAGAKDVKTRDAVVKKALNKVSPLLQRFIATLVTERELAQFDAIVRAYAALLRRTDNLVEIAVETPKELSAAELKRLTSMLDLKKRTPLVTQRITPELIGGLRIVVDDVEHDHSIAGALNRLQNQLTA